MDIHTKLMKKYEDIPNWWFYLMLVISFALSLALCIFMKDQVQMPWWGLVFAAGLALLFTLPISIITATTNQTPGLNVITEYIMGVILPGRPIANVCFKTYGYISMSQAVSFLNDFKLGHYMKIPPRSMFIVQDQEWTPHSVQWPATSFWCGDCRLSDAAYIAGSCFGFTQGKRKSEENLLLLLQYCSYSTLLKTLGLFLSAKLLLFVPVERKQLDSMLVSTSKEQTSMDAEYHSSFLGKHVDIVTMTARRCATRCCAHHCTAPSPNSSFCWSILIFAHLLLRKMNGLFSTQHVVLLLKTTGE